MSKTPKSKTASSGSANTLFSYFNKTPTTTTTTTTEKNSSVKTAADDGDRRSTADEKRSPAPASAKGDRSPPPPLPESRTPNLNDKKGNKKRKISPKDDLNDDLGVVPFDLVWAKLEGHPWWPSIVCVHPKDKTISRKQGKSRLIHVQFFDNPPTRGWVKAKFLRPFTGSDCKEYQRGGQLFSTDVKCRKAAVEADAALKLAKTDRADLIVAMDTSESEDESTNGEEESSPSENGDSEKEKGKENETPPSRDSPQKSPKKLTRSATGKRPAKRRRIIVESDEEEAQSDHSAEDNFKPDSEEESSDEDQVNSSDAVESEEMETDSDAMADSPVKKTTKRQKAPKGSSKKTEREPQGVVRKSTKNTISSSKRPSKPKPSSSPPSSESSTLNSSFVSDTTKSRLAAFSANDSVLASSNESSDGRCFPHMTLDFLKPEKIRDAEKRTKDDPNYDPRTLYIPESFLAKQTPGMQQWWILKASHFDTVLFFKMGKFYELFHMDATIAVNELGMVFMKGEHAHSGFPEIAYGRYSDMLIQKGYKIARIEQTETPEMMTERCKQMRNCSKVDRVVKREICSIQTKGTKRYSFIDGDAGCSTSNFLLSVCEKVDSATSGTYGVCFVDTSIGKFYVGQFQDDRHGSRLRTLISHYPPAQVLCERGRLSEKTKTIFNSNLATVMKEELKPSTEFWDSGTTLKFLAESDYFKDNSKTGDGFCWPDGLKEMIADANGLGRSAAPGYELGLSALGAVVWYLRHCLMDEELLSMKTFANYSPVDLLTQVGSQKDSPDISTKHAAMFNSQKRLVLDGVTLANLDVLVNSSTGSIEGTLLERVQHCSTAFGKRLFKQWLCAPLCNPSSIEDRLNAVEDLMKINDIVTDVSDMMKKLPDLERLLNKIHVLGSARRSKEHPDSRAIFFEDGVYSKRKIEDFLLTLDGFKKATELVSKFRSVSGNFRSKLLKQCVIFADTELLGKFPDLKEQLDFFDKAFDHQKAKSAGVIKPSKGVNMDYDEAVADIQTTEDALNSYLGKQQKLLGCKSISYWGTGRNRFQMEIPESSLKNIPDTYEVTSQRKGFRRYQTEEIRRLHSQLTDAEERRDAAQKDTMRCVFHQFDKHYRQWDEAVQCLAVLDVLISLSYYSSHGDGSMCRPELVLPEGSDFRPFIEIRSGRHPCIGRTFSGGDFIPNDTIIGLSEEENDDRSEAQIVLVTGPNMGGKSTLMRQVGTVVILAQLGCYVPAEKCRLTPVDRVFTRLGASDNIIGGESTFFVELSETSAILQHATEHSLVLLDELGRGTATYDGTAIACAVVKELSENIRCRTLFSTHYHSLVEEFSHDTNVRLGHMACMVENENEEDPSEETITFLYQFGSGACPKSYGFNAAQLATIPDEVVRLARKKAREYEDSFRIINTFRKIWTLEKSETDKLCDILNTLDDLL